MNLTIRYSNLKNTDMVRLFALLPDRICFRFSLRNQGHFEFKETHDVHLLLFNVVVLLLFGIFVLKFPLSIWNCLPKASLAVWLDFPSSYRRLFCRGLLLCAIWSWESAWQAHFLNRSSLRQLYLLLFQDRYIATQQWFAHRLAPEGCHMASSRAHSVWSNDTFAKENEEDYIRRGL